MKELFSEDSKVPEHRQVAGSATYKHSSVSCVVLLPLNYIMFFKGALQMCSCVLHVLIDFFLTRCEQMVT